MLSLPPRLTSYRPSAPQAPSQSLEAVRADAVTLQQAATEPVGGAPSIWAHVGSRLNSVARNMVGTAMGLVAWGQDKLKGPGGQQPLADEPTGGGVATVRRGAKGGSVRTLQERLKAHGFNPGPSDGIFGPKTDAAVRAFQRAKGLVVDGIVGPKTWGALGVKGAPAPGPGSSSKVQNFIAQAKRYQGQRYVWGGGHSTTTRIGGVDCSGLVQQAARLAGFNLDGTAAMQQRRGHAVSMKALKPGDLLFHGNPASHVGIYIGNGQAIHASSSQGRVVIVNLSSYTYFNNARRVM